MRRREMGNPTAVSEYSLLELTLRTLLCLVAVEVAVVDNASSFAHRDGCYADDGLLLVSPTQLCTALPWFRTWTHSRKKLRLKSTPDRTYLFVTVMRIEDPQYERIAATGFSVIEAALLCEAARVTGEGALELLEEGMSTL
jgi:hypothetical protein